MSMKSLVKTCKHQDSTWPGDGKDVVYARVYTQIDGDPDKHAIYVGWTRGIQSRDRTHMTDMKRSFPSVEGKPNHYDIAKRGTGRHYILILVHAPLGSLNRDTPMVSRMIEQTCILMLKSYTPWIAGDARNTDLGKLAGKAVLGPKARLLSQIERKVRNFDTGFQSYWEAYGCNLDSPLWSFLFDKQTNMDPSKVGLVIVTPSPGTLTPHMTTFRSAHWFGVLNKAGQHAHRTKTCFRGPSTAADGTASTIRRFRMSVPENLSRKIVASICKEHMRTGKGFNAILAFEIMKDGPHSRPFVSFTSFGPYEDFSAPNCLGVRIEWLTSEGKWKTAPIVYSEMGLQRIWSPMSLHGDASKLMWAWHNVAGLIQMLRDQTCPNARLGGFQRLWSKGCLPMIQTLEIDHLKQTVTWEPRSEPEEVPAPVEATRKHNDEWMATWLMSPVNDLLQFTFPGMRPGAPIFSIDMLSAQLANREGGQECDSCILKRRLRRMTTKIPQCSPISNVFSVLLYTEAARSRHLPHLSRAGLVKARIRKRIFSELRIS